MFFFHVGVYLFPSELPPKIQEQLDQTLYAKYIATVVERVTGIRQPGLIAATDDLRDNVESTYGPSRIEVLALTMNANLGLSGFPLVNDYTLPVDESLWRFLEQCRIWASDIFDSAWLALIAPTVFSVCRQYAALPFAARQQLKHDGLTAKHMAAWETHTRQYQAGTRQWCGHPLTPLDLRCYTDSVQNLAHDIITGQIKPLRFPRSFRKVLQDIQWYDIAYRYNFAMQQPADAVKITELPETQRIITIH